MKVNDFNEDLKYSHEMEQSPVWKDIYNKAFPDNKGFFRTRENGQGQYLGVDTTLILSSGKTIYIDEKARRIYYPDILLEYISDDKKNTKGWVEKPLFCDYIAYVAIINDEYDECYILPVPQLQKVWTQNKNNWLKKYGTIKSPNNYYNTLNCPIPVNILYLEFIKSLKIKGENYERNNKNFI